MVCSSSADKSAVTYHLHLLNGAGHAGTVCILTTVMDLRLGPLGSSLKLWLCCTMDFIGISNTGKM